MLARRCDERLESALHVGDAATASSYYADAENGRKVRTADTRALAEE